MNKAVKMLMGLIALAAIVIGVMYAMKLGPFKSEAHWWHHLGHDVGRGLHHVGHALDRGAHGALHIAEHPIRSTEHGFEHVGHFVEHPIRGIEHGWHRLFGRRHHHHHHGSRGKVYTPQPSPAPPDSIFNANTSHVPTADTRSIESADRPAGSPVGTTSVLGDETAGENIANIKYLGVM